MSTVFDPIFDPVLSQEWTPELLAELLTEPRDHDLDWRRFEIVDGVLVVSPPPVPSHEYVVMEIGAVLRQSAPDGFHVIGSAGIALGRSYRVTDVTVLDARVFESLDSVIRPDDVLLAVEIESPSSITTDRVTKPAQYAAAGIRHYWRIETDPLRLVTYRLSGDVYEQTGSWGAGEIARIAEPLSVELDPASLLPT